MIASDKIHLHQRDIRKPNNIAIFIGFMQVADLEGIQLQFPAVILALVFDATHCQKF